MKKNLHYGWIICVLAVLTMFCTMGLSSNTFSIYINAFIEENGFTKAQGASLPTIRCVASLVGTIICGIYYDKLNMRKGLAMSVSMIGIAFLIYSRAHTLPVFYVGAFIAGLGYGLGTMVPVTLLINRWFAAKQGFVLGIVSAGTGLATIVCPPLITAGLEAGGVALAASVEGILILVYAALMLLLLRNQPSDKGLLPYGADVCHNSIPDVDPQTHALASASRLPKHLEKAVLLAPFLIGIVTAPNAESLAVHLATAGLDAGTVSLAVSTFGIAMTIGKLLYGAMADRIGIFYSNMFFSCILVSGFASGWFVSGSLVAVAFFQAACLGAGYSMTTITFSLYANSFYTGKKAADAVRHFWVATLVGSLMFTTVPGVVADMTGSYRLYQVCCIPVFIAGMVLLQVLYKKYVMR